ncbi:hypothetical protein HYT58_01140 [Candidatus Woesearchaeota archaeon]|nr:hypothetical protein [Candidatus Woesearchaeota archaeon]
MGWRARVDAQLRNHLEKQIQETGKHRASYSQAKEPGNAQLWIAVANLSREIVDLSLKLKFLEGALKDMGEKQVQNQIPHSQILEDIPKVEIIMDEPEKKAIKQKTRNVKKVKRKKR